MATRGGADYPHRVYVRNVEFFVTHADVRAGLAKLDCLQSLQNIQVLRSGAWYPNKKCSLFLAYQTEEACRDVVAKLDGQYIAGCTTVPASAEMAVPRMQRLPKMMQPAAVAASSSSTAGAGGIEVKEDGYDGGVAAPTTPPWRQLRRKEELEGLVEPVSKKEEQEKMIKKRSGKRKRSASSSSSSATRSDASVATILPEGEKGRP